MTDRAAFLAGYRSVKRGCAYRETADGVGIYTLPAFSAQPGIRHGFSARMGGVSSGDLASLNLSFTRGEDYDNVMENYRIFCRAADIPVPSMVMDHYEHGTAVLPVTRADCGRGYTREPLPFCDGLVTADPGVTLMTGHADCMAFYFYDPVTRCIGLCHAGWRGAKDRIGFNVVRAMRALSGANPADILSGVGPSICPACFEVGADVAEDFSRAFPLCTLVGQNERGNPTVDLWQVAVCQFAEAGIPFANMSLMGACTFEDLRLYSHRREKGRTGGMTAFLRLTE